MHYAIRVQLSGNPYECWIDFGAIHIYALREIFTSCAITGLDDTIFTENSAMTKNDSYEKIFLNMILCKMNNVFHLTFD